MIGGFRMFGGPVLQRNISGSPLVLPTLEPPVEIPPGGEIDYPQPLAGFEPVQPPKPEPKAKTKAPAPSDDKEVAA